MNSIKDALLGTQVQNNKNNALSHVIAVLISTSFLLFFCSSHVLKIDFGLLREAYADPCVKQSNQLLTSFSPTDQLIGYLGELLEGHAISEGELARFLDALERGRVTNPIREEDAETETKRLIHFEGLKKIIDRAGFDLARLKEWTRRAIEHNGAVQVKRGEAKSETQEINQKLDFARIEPGQFRMGIAKNDERDIILTHPFEVMSTPVTQKQWVEVMGENPSQFSEGENTVTVTLNGQKMRMQPDNPVEQVTWWSVLVFLNKLSERRGLPPVYELKDVVFKPNTRAENGTLDVKDESQNNAFKILAPEGNIYRARGYRLPTEAEQEYLLRAGGKSNAYYHYGDATKNLKDYAWYGDNSSQTTHPVGLLKPIIVNGNMLFDLSGNVAEWSQDPYGIIPVNVTLTDPTGGDPLDSLRVIRGGSWKSKPDILMSGHRDYELPGRRSPVIGFRVARTLR